MITPITAPKITAFVGILLDGRTFDNQLRPGNGAVSAERERHPGGRLVMHAVVQKNCPAAEMNSTKKRHFSDSACTKMYVAPRPRPPLSGALAAS